MRTTLKFFYVRSLRTPGEDSLRWTLSRPLLDMFETWFKPYEDLGTSFMIRRHNCPCGASPEEAEGDPDAQSYVPLLASQHLIGELSQMKLAC